MNRPVRKAVIRLAVAAIALVVIIAWLRFPWQAFAQPFLVMP